MEKTITVIYDGQALRPEAELDLQPHARYTITIDTTPLPSMSGDAWDVLEQYAGTIDAPPDWSSEHDHYLYGLPKRTASE